MCSYRAGGVKRKHADICQGGILLHVFDDTHVVISSPPFLFLIATIEKATRLYEQSPKTDHEVRKGHLGIQAHIEGFAKGKGKDGPYLIQLPSIAKVGSRILVHACQDPSSPLRR